MKKRILSILAAIGLLTAPAAFAQTAVTPFNQPWYLASSFGLYALQNQLPNSYIFAGRSVCNSSAQGLNFFVFNTNAPVYIADQTTTNSEVVTPSAITNTAGSCGVTVSPSHQHYTFSLRSGTAGLQEAINTLTNTGAVPATVLLDRNWWVTAANVPSTSGPQIISKIAAGVAGIELVDITTSPFTYYTWNATATQYQVAGGASTPPTLAVTGGGAGTGPASTSISGNSASGTIKFTTGTTPAASTAVFTLAFPTPANGGVGYAQACAFTSIGANAYTSGTSASVFTSVNTVTFTSSASAMTASVPYVFNYRCK